MCKWRITSKKHARDAESLEAYDSIYRSLLGSSQHRAIKAVFMDSGRQPVVGELNIEP
jgi:hypothetical protein